MLASRPKFVWVATILATFCVAEVHAQDAAPSSEKPKSIEKFTEKFDAADSNHDGFLTREEAAKGMPRIAKTFRRNRHQSRRQAVAAGNRSISSRQTQSTGAMNDR